MTSFLVFGDLHGRVLPAFRLATAWGREHGASIAGLLQVGDVGYFPDSSRLDQATLRHALEDPLELGVQEVTEPSARAEAIFAGPEPVPEALWFTAGNHEDFDALAQQERLAPDDASFPVDAYGRVRALRDGAVATLPGELRVGALWGIEPSGRGARPRTPAGGYLRPKSAARLAAARFDVLLTHDSPPDAIMALSGSPDIGAVIAAAQPAFAFFGHYGGRDGQIPGDFGRTQVYHLCGMELQRSGSCAEPGSVGVLRWDGTAGEFEYLDERWLRTFTRHNWELR